MSMKPKVATYEQIAEWKAQKAAWEADTEGLVDPPSKYVPSQESLIALIEQQNGELTLAYEQLAMEHLSAQFCQSCGLLLPNHEDGCGRYSEIVKELEEKIRELKSDNSRLVRDLKHERKSTQLLCAIIKERG